MMGSQCHRDPSLAHDFYLGGDSQSTMDPRAAALTFKSELTWKKIKHNKWAHAFTFKELLWKAHTILQLQSIYVYRKTSPRGPKNTILRPGSKIGPWLASGN